MDLRLTALAAFDDRAVPLPHGTEVITRVERSAGDTRVPQGAIGRVVATTDAGVDVAIVGLGTVRYARDELTPRRTGQMLWAVRREFAWETLSACRVLEATVGSRAWGLADEGSDTNLRGAFALPFPWTTGLVAPPEDLVSADGSATYWEIGKMIRQALRADPNTLEALFVDDVRPLDPIGQWLLDERDAFVWLEIYGSFGRYAVAQLRRLEQTARLAEHRALVLSWIRERPGVSLDEIAERLGREALGGTSRDDVARAKQHVKQLYRSMHDQGLIEAADFAAMARFALDRDAAFDPPKDLRPKNAYNLLRLLVTATEWLRTGEPRFRVEGALRDQLAAIKRGEVPLGEVLAAAEAMVPELDAAHSGSSLPARPDVARADALLRRVREEVARRWFARAPGVFGADAPAPPEVTWAT